VSMRKKEKNKGTHLDDGVRHLRTGHDGICAHHTVGILLVEFVG
jgi:hypothetical protein